MKLVVIGAVAAGTSAAAKASRNDPELDIVIYERDQDISYSGCGLPYYIGGEVEDMDALTPRDPSFFKEKYNINIKVRHEVQSIDHQSKEVTVKNLDTGDTFTDHYDQLVLATGASPFVPPLEGVDQSHVFTLRNPNDARSIVDFINQHRPKSAVIVGTGFIGLEMLENLYANDIDVTVVEKMPQITPNLDEDMAEYLEELITNKGFRILKDATITHVEQDHVKLEDSPDIDAELVIVATGVRPNTQLASNMGVELGETKAIKVDERMQTNLEDVYACGDCIETFLSINHQPVFRPLGSTANKTGRIAGDALTGGSSRYQGNLGTGIYQLFDLTIANTGLTEKAAIESGYDVVVADLTKANKPRYLGGEKMRIKAVADRHSRQILGAQIIGKEGVDKRIDVFVTLISYMAKVEDLFHLDLAYAPPYSNAKDPVHFIGMIFEKKFDAIN
ncbi:NADPH-dependent 2,4-dienoyl-CoA reductase, sulfur reductase [Pelagirhabdus alkalitolerans]|uniref:NADPH-dependent 2,4-dienoyl-CoA reductase, sulfur reductase n=1 Tax=Pelagirhabdus alkalitolerans TaxID=1612202 RepID=A0A1G6IM21_9BACI|nr:FAD-dependent oxidoreductase [Pelagirhabdus alkalitolerans]SDC07537.1 NADPH-dependent 2,4-dienoyl-CoA reductase, sulfur reductase [Pelagirhabdus alkalitolerans]